MNQLSNIIDSARFSRATSMKRGMIALDQPHRRRQAGGLMSTWRRDSVSGQLICVWATTLGARDAEPPLRRSLAA